TAPAPTSGGARCTDARPSRRPGGVAIPAARLQGPPGRRHSQPGPISRIGAGRRLLHMMTLTTRTHTVIDSPLRPLTLVAADRPPVVADDGVLSGLYLPGHVRGPGPESLGDRDDEGFDEITKQLAEYFASTRTAFTVPVAPAGTPFQQSVWRELMSIPYGQTR